MKSIFASYVPVIALMVIVGPLAAQPKEWTPKLMMQVKRIGGVQVSPDGKRVVYAVKQAVLDGGKSEYLTHIHIANADGSGSIQLTQGDKSCDDPQWSPSGEWIAFTSARGGKRNVWLLPAAGGESAQVTDVKTSVTSFKWSPDNSWIAYTAMEAPTPAEEQAKKEKNDARVVDENIKMSRLSITSLPAAGKQITRVLTKGPINVSAAGRAGYDWAPDSKTIAFSHTRTPLADDWPSADISLVNVDDGTVRPLVNTKAAEFSPHYSPDGKWIAYVVTNDPPTWAGAARIHVIPADGGKSIALAETFDGFGRYSEIVGWGKSHSVYYTEINGTRTRFCEAEVDEELRELFKKRQFLNEGDGVASGIHLNATGTHIGFSWESPGRAPEACVNITSRRPAFPSQFDGNPVSKVNSHLPKLPLGRTEVIRWKSTDGLEIEGLLTYPATYEKGKRYPLLLNVHGGPAGAFTQTYIGTPGSYPIAAFSSRGYAVLRPNPRGSSGYGKKFRHANYGDWGGGDFKDLMTGVDHVIKMGVGDENRLGVMGWSYGGFMISWTITQTQRFKAASVGAGVTNLMSFTGTADIPSFLPDYFGGEPWDNFDAYRKHSAMFNVKGVKTPTLIQHGERDERVPLSQGQEFYNALKRQGCPVKMVIYPRTPHGIEEPRLLVDCMERNLEWFDRHIGKTK